MPTVSFAGCLANYWYLWMIDGAGSIFSLLINLAVAYFFMKYFQFLAHGGPAPPKKPASQFSNFQSSSPTQMPVGAWAHGNTTGNVFNTVRP